MLKLDILKYLIPYKCPVCNRLNYNPICKECMTQLLKKVPTAIHELRFDGINLKYIFKYDGVVRNIIKEVKYRKQKKLMVYIMKQIVNSVDYDFSKYDYITFIPVSAERGKIRGFDQAEIIAENLNDKKLLKSLVRHKNTSALYGLSKKERQSEMYDAFLLEQPDLIKGKSLLLVDDICSSGSSLKSAANLFYEAGVKKIDCFALAYKSI